MAILTEPGQRAYLLDVLRRDRRAKWNTRLRYGVMHSSWIIVLLAGAAVSLVEGFDLPSWVPAVLGFVIVVFQGLDRIFEKTADGALAMDRLRRGLECEQRQLVAGAGEYQPLSEAERALRFTNQCEQLIQQNDETMGRYMADLARSPERSSGRGEPLAGPGEEPARGSPA